MCGAILGFAALAPKNDSAISLSFGDSGYTTALARVFKWVRSLLLFIMPYMYSVVRFMTLSNNPY